MSPKSRIRAASFHVLASLGVFVLLFVAAMILYPGGTWTDRSSVGYDFFRNYFCDLTADVALDGRSNPGARLAVASMIVVGVGLGPFWFVVTHGWTRDIPLKLVVRVLGLLSSVALVAVPLLPSGRYGVLHAIAILIAGVPGLVAAIFAVVGLFRETNARSTRLIAWFSTLTLVLAAIDGALYAWTVVSGREVAALLLPALQKLAMIALFAWMTATCLLHIRTDTHPET